MTGALAQVQDRVGNGFAFRYDLLGRPRGITMPGGVTDTLAYDRDGRLVWRRESSPQHGSIPLQEEAMVYDARGKLLRVNTAATVARGASVYTQWYSGLGNLVATDWSNENDPQWSREQFRVDPLGNVVRKRTYTPGTEGPDNDYPDFAYLLDPQYGSVRQVSLVDVATTAPLTGYLNDDTYRSYDASGNVVAGRQGVETLSGDGSVSLTRVVQSRSYYGADDKLYAFQEYDDRFGGSATGQGAGVWEEYRYDPLGRRVMVRTRREAPLCTINAETCISSTTRFVWAGGQILWELKTASGQYSSQAGGRVSYTHAGGIDRPLAIWKDNVGSIVTHQNWRGQFARGTFGAGSRAGQLSDCSAADAHDRPIDAANATTVARVMTTGVRQHTTYDVMDRPFYRVTTGPGMAHAAAA